MGGRKYSLVDMIELRRTAEQDKKKKKKEGISILRSIPKTLSAERTTNPSRREGYVRRRRRTHSVVVVVIIVVVRHERRRRGISGAQETLTSTASSTR